MPGMDTGSAKDGVGQVFDAVDAFDAYLNPTEDTQDGEGEEEIEQEAEAGEAEQEVEAQTDESEESEEAEVEDEEEQGEQKPARTFTVRIDGKDEAVPESELIAGYQRQADYTRKTQALANDRKAFDTERQTVIQERTEYAALLPKLREALSNGLGKEPDWEALRAQDPAKAAVEYQRFQERKQRVAAVQAEEQRLADQQRQEQQATAQRIIAEEAEKSLKLMPHWKSDDVKQRETTAITQMLRDLGFAENETTIYDSRALYIAHLASKYLELQKQKPALKQKIAVAPVAKPGTGQKARPQSEVQKAQRRLAKSGSMRDAAKAFEAFV